MGTVLRFMIAEGLHISLPGCVCLNRQCVCAYVGLMSGYFCK